MTFVVELMDKDSERIRVTNYGRTERIAWVDGAGVTIAVPLDAKVQIGDEIIVRRTGSYLRSVEFTDGSWATYGDDGIVLHTRSQEEA